MNKYKYSWTRHYGIDAQIVGEVVQKLRTRTADELLEAARSESSPLHGVFEWDDSLAARQYRLVQARIMLSSLRVEVITKDNKPKAIMAFVRQADRSGYYVPALEADDADLEASELRCWQQMKSFREKWKDLQFARDVVQAIAETSKRVARRRKRA